MSGNSVSGTISSICSSIIATFKSFFGIHSPSKLMAEMGGYLDEGLANGIAGNEKKAVNAMRSLSTKTANAFNPNLSVGTSVSRKIGLSGSGAIGGNTITQNNYFTQKELSAFETLQEQRKLNKQLVGAFV